MVERQVSTENRRPQRAIHRDPARRRHFDNRLTNASVGQLDRKWLVFLTGLQQANGAGGFEGSSLSQLSSKCLDLHSIEVEEDRRIELADLLIGDHDISVAHHEEAVGFGVLQRSSQDQAQIDVTAFDVHRVASQRGQNIEGVPMAFNLQIQGFAAAEGSGAKDRDRFLAVLAPERKIHADAVGSVGQSATVEDQWRSAE